MTHILPHSLEAERSVLGGILLRPSAFGIVSGTVAAEDFYHQAHQSLFRAMAALSDAHQPIDELTVAEEMRRAGSFGKLRAFNDEAYFAELTSAVVTVENIAWHARMVRGKAQARRLIEAAQSIAARGYGEYGDLDDFLNESARDVCAIAQSGGGDKVRPLREYIVEAIAQIEERYDRHQAGAPAAISTTFADIDAALVGWEAGDLVILAARPGMGKTSFVMNSIQGAAAAGVPCLVFSLEMKGSSLGTRLLSSEAPVNSFALRDGRLDGNDFQRIHSAGGRLAKLPIWVDASSGLTIDELSARARAWRADVDRGGRIDPKTKKRTDAVIAVDYLQIIRGARQGEERVQFVSRVSADLKQLARELEVPVLALSQLNRELERRDNKRPVMADLRDSGAIEQDADVIAFLYRHAVYDKQADRSVAEFILGKQRNGDCVTVPLRWRPEVTRFEDAQAARGLAAVNGGRTWHGFAQDEGE
jgi:replicative DNA helicase